MGTSHNITPDYIQEKYIELIESANMHLENKNKTFSTKNILIYTGLVSIILLALFSYDYFFNGYNSTFSNNLLAVPYNEHSILIQEENGVFYQVTKDTNERWLTDDNLFISVTEDKLVFNKKSFDDTVNQAYYTLWIPSNKEFEVELTDGTLISLNSNSQLKFTNNRNTSKMNAKIVGEAFFDVAHNPKEVYKIQASDMLIEVYGTEFNVCNKTSEPTNVALIHGSVSVTSKHSKKYIIPGEKAILDKNNKQIMITKADFDKTLAWRMKQLNFIDEPLKTIIEKIETWHDVTFELTNKRIKDIRFTGQIDKKDSIIHFLQMLQYTEHINYSINEHSITLSK